MCSFFEHARMTMDQLKCKWLPLMSKAPTPASLSLGNSQFFWQDCLNIFEILKKGNQSATACPDFGTFFSCLCPSHHLSGARLPLARLGRKDIKNLKSCNMAGCAKPV
jgi:hypothetical protein